MKTGQPIIGRPAWYDRNPASKADIWTGAGVAPHAATTRKTYTCPAGKKAMVEVLELSVIRETAATTVGTAQAYVTITPSGGSAIVCIAAWIRTNTVADRNDAFLGASMLLFPGDRIDLMTLDLSTGGTCAYFVCYKITEFDA